MVAWCTGQQISFILFDFYQWGPDVKEELCLRVCRSRACVCGHVLHVIHSVIRPAAALVRFWLLPSNSDHWHSTIKPSSSDSSLYRSIFNNDTPMLHKGLDRFLRRIQIITHQLCSSNDDAVHFHRWWTQQLGHNMNKYLDSWCVVPIASERLFFTNHTKMFVQLRRVEAHVAALKHSS